jgi:hypothetical protein
LDSTIYSRDPWFIKSDALGRATPTVPAPNASGQMSALGLLPHSEPSQQTEQTPCTLPTFGVLLTARPVRAVSKMVVGLRKLIGVLRTPSAELVAASRPAAFGFSRAAGKGHDAWPVCENDISINTTS